MRPELEKPPIIGPFLLIEKGTSIMKENHYQLTAETSDHFHSSARRAFVSAHDVQAYVKDAHTRTAHAGYTAIQHRTCDSIMPINR